MLMKKIGKEPMTRSQLTRRYYDSNNLVLFSARIDGELASKLKERLSAENKSMRAFIIEAIEEYLER